MCSTANITPSSGHAAPLLKGNSTFYTNLRTQPQGIIMLAKTNSNWSAWFPCSTDHVKACYFVPKTETFIVQRCHVTVLTNWFKSM